MEGALANASPRGRMLQLALALIALLATLIPDVRGPVAWRTGALPFPILSEPAPEGERTVVSYAVSFIEEADEDPDGRKARPALGGSVFTPDAADDGNALSARSPGNARARAHHATGPPAA